jgi:phage FluMu gp28-like protein
MAKRKDQNSSTTQTPDDPVAKSKGARVAKKKASFNNPIPVLPYQERWIEDDSPLKVAVWSRQSGKSFAAALRATLKCANKRTQYIVLSKGERQSRLFMEKVKDFCQTLKDLKVLSTYEELPESDEKTMEVFFPDTGSRIIGLPANPDTARGYSGNIVLDEFAFHGDAHKIYAACFPIITRGYSIEVISTPNGTAGKFYEIAKQAGLVVAQDPLSGPAALAPGIGKAAGPESGSRATWSGHRVDIYDAVNQGLPANLQLLRSGCDDEETWLQEYCCQFLSDAQNYIPIELISSCVHEEAGTGSTGFQPVSGHGQDGRATAAELYLGVDIGRKRDLTIAWLFEKVGGVLWSRHLLTLKGVSFDEQERAICALIEGRNSKLENRQSSAAVRRCSVDQSGLGMMLAEHLVQKYGEVVEPVQFTAPFKERVAPMVKMAFEERTVRIPDNREVRADLNSVKRFVTPAGNVRFDAEHTDRGHADRFWALALVVNAATHPAASFSEQAFLAGEPVMHGFAEVVL